MGRVRRKWEVSGMSFTSVPGVLLGISRWFYLGLSYINTRVGNQVIEWKIEVILAVPMSNFSGQNLCISFTFSIAILNGTHSHCSE